MGARIFTSAIIHEVYGERVRQDQKWGEQNHPDGTGGGVSVAMASLAKEACDAADERGTLTWKDILREEYAEAVAESDAVKLREELIQVAAVAVAWVEAIDRRGV